MSNEKGIAGALSVLGRRQGRVTGTNGLHVSAAREDRRGRSKSLPRLSANCSKGKHASCSMVECICNCGYHKAAK